MTYEEAKKILDQVRCGEGGDVGAATIDCALYLTGDLELHEGERGAGMDSKIPQEDWRGRCRSRSILVGTNERRNLQSPWRRGFAFPVEADGARAC